MDKILKFENMGQIIEYQKNGKILCQTSDPDQSKDLILNDRAKWFTKILHNIFEENKHIKKFRFLLDMSKIYEMNPDEQTFIAYAKVINDPRLDKIAIVGDSLKFVSLGPVFKHINKTKEQIQFFLELTQAQDWLDWNN